MITRSASAQSTPPQQPWLGRSHAAIFVRCLHLLDLDLLNDWPGVTEHAFTAKAAQQSLQHRVKAVEWSLYRLFEIYDHDETKDKLRPFFPPATQLQSLNLRAALYRCLTELKKNGVLGKDVLLRKTMLDDCKGERFEEAIANFAMVVLKKSSCSSTPFSKGVQRDFQLLPMILAYRSSLQRSLRARADVDAETKQKRQRLQEAEVNLQERLQNVKSRSLRVDPEEKKRLHSLVNRNWIGNHTWIDVLLHGIPTEGALEKNGLNDTASRTDESQSLLQDLDDRISKYRSRLSEWRIVAKDMKSQLDLRRVATKSETTPAKRSAPSRFVAHKNLNMVKGGGEDMQEVPMDASYAELLEEMKQELAMASTNTRKLKEEILAQETTSSVIDESTIPQASRVTLEELSSRSASEDVGATMLPDEYAGHTDTVDEPLQAQSSPTTELSSLDDSPWIPQQLSSITKFEGKPASRRVSSQTRPGSSQDPSTSPSLMWMSLAERTKATMSLTGRPSILVDPESPIHQAAKTANNTTVSDLQLSSDEDRRTTLIERTRKSMSLLASASSSRPKRKSIRVEKRTSQLFPVNQFETPGKPRAQLQTQPGADWLTPNPDAAGSGSSTPRDKLFDEDAEYASVFKSRPKIALSPAFSPQRASGIGLDSILERDFDAEDTDEDIDMNRLDLESD